MSGTRSAKPVTDVTTIVRQSVDGEELREVASFKAGRVRCVFDHNGNAELTMRVPAQDKHLVIPMTDYPGIEMHITAYVPEGIE